ncbi:MAG: hypothetical protein JXJ04_15940 [Spirochaetales bacterium]|nr:hypothetical protein [Spirochaetales bacterium]
MNTMVDEIMKIQQNYWTFNKGEKEILLSQFPRISDWKDLLRLHHLLCMEAFHDHMKGNFIFSRNKISSHNNTYLELQKTLAMLLSDESPYVPQQSEIKFDILTRHKEFKKLTGILMNGSLTHLGSIEIVNVDSELTPLSISFLPLTHIKSIMINSKGTLISYRNKKEKDICYLASHYYVSKESRKYINSNETEYICTKEYENDHNEYGIGLGPQELVIIQQDGSKVHTHIQNNAIITTLPHLYEYQYREKVI